jgi:ABC-type sugar transport system, permease component
VTSRLDRYSTYAALGVFSVLAIYPLLSIIFLAFHKKTDNVTGFSLPTTISLHTFTAAWTEGGFAKGMWGSFLVAGSVTAVAAVLSLLTGYALGTMRFRGSGLWFNLMILGLIFPYEATVIPLYYDFQDVHLTGTYWTLILPQIGQSVRSARSGCARSSSPRRARSSRPRGSTGRAACASCGASSFRRFVPRC